VSFTLSALLLLSVPEPQQLPVVGARSENSGHHVSPIVIRYAQVRIQKRVIIRVPRRRPARAMRLADIQRQSKPTSYKEKKIGKCLPMANILGVQMFGGRYLDLITKDRKRIRAGAVGKKMPGAQLLFRLLYGKIGRREDLCGP